MTAPVPFPGGTSVSRLRVYDWPAPDLTSTAEGLAGSGTPHLHTASSEGYVVLAGRGAVQTLGSDGYTENELVPGTVAWFTPGVVHRLVNGGGLELLVVMSNAGLPEAGDAVLTFPPEVLADRDRYRAAAALPSVAEVGEAAVAEAARRRRDLALEGYVRLRRAVEERGPAALQELHDAAARLVADLVPNWDRTWHERIEPTASGTRAALDALAGGTGPHLGAGAVAVTSSRPGPERFGMCGRLTTWPL